MRSDFFTRRFPTRIEIFAVFGAAVFFVYTWSIRGFLYKIPSFVLYFSIGEILAVFSYMMAFALLESVLVTGGLVLLGFFLPGIFLRQGFTYKGFLALLVGAVTMIFFQGALKNETMDFVLFYKGAGLAILILAGLIVLIEKIKFFKQAVNYVVDGVAVFTYLYVPLGVISLAVVVIRNLF